MKTNTTLPLGSIILIDKVEKDFGMMSGIFGDMGGNTCNFIGATKLLLNNRMDNAVLVHQILPMSSDEIFELLGINGSILKRSLYRNLQKIGREFPIFLERYPNYDNYLLYYYELFGRYLFGEQFRLRLARLTNETHSIGDGWALNNPIINFNYIESLIYHHLNTIITKHKFSDGFYTIYNRYRFIYSPTLYIDILGYSLAILY